MELLRDVRVLEVSLFSADALGGHLADLGAEVIKVEPPGGGGFRGSAVSGGDLQDSHWNRGKKSVAINLKTSEGQEAFRRLAAKAAVVIDGLRYGTADRLGFSYDDIVAVNPTVVYCALNGMGSYGPYTRLPTHGLSFDCFAGLSPPIIEADGTPRLSGAATGTTGVLAGPLYAAMGVLAALHAARRDDKPQYIEVAQVDAAINWNFQHLTALANGQPAYGEGIRASLRYQYYETSDGNYVVFNALEDKFWRRFCESLDRMDLYEPGRRKPGADAEAEAWLREELTAMFKSRTRRAWTDFFIATDIAGAPAFLGADLFEDDHTKARRLVYEQAQADGTSQRFIGTCIKTKPDEDFAPPAAPHVGQQTEELLAALAGYEPAGIARLRAIGAI
ncbi:formyl-CoA transferase [Mycobacterium malmoense]|uniref:CaiB/BaiF CoA transferase family protein n=1 Tax=Mycobacterium malmoense TaxID=1780 RepID=UPI00080BCB9D|nr:CaiB/BaiF CoA-transferase family protein [Mycobacterium malmoense]OCB27528.1 formyl-CoA transferase [Mycobacterium malmoense]OCB40637.1 formyl-CoA transferase [Mycobacterium malmoense]